MKVLKFTSPLNKITRLKITGLTLLLCTAGQLYAQQDRIQSLADLKAVQTKIQNVSAKVQPATVALISNTSGASGSGVVINESGLILTAAHVITGNRKMDVVFPNGDVFPAEVLGANLTKDIAMVQLDSSKKWPHVEIGESSTLVVGDHVIAMGHAGGYDPKRKPPVRFGRLLSKNSHGFITTDCTLIGGDSGGPLFDMDGKVIGINSSIGNTFSTNNHAGITSLKADWDRLKKGDTWGMLNQNPMSNPERAFIGIGYNELRDRDGLLVERVVRDSPAHAAGILANDIILKIDDAVIKDGRDLEVTIANYNSGDEVVLTISRNQEETLLPLTFTSLGEIANQ